MELNSLIRPKGLERSRRVGRGGKRGKTSGRGGKGQTARAGNKRRPEWRDIIKKLPKRRGYGRNRSRTAVPRTAFAPVSLDKVSEKFNAGETVSPITLVRAKLVRRVSHKIPPVKILAGTLSKKLAFENVLMSQSAKEAVEKAGGTIVAAKGKEA
ncbi:MAG: uL15 family ribosomal protein [Patescibacteria group bacterium]|nr:uL15 family ribosomal protein [Patescibacteria group bacterium]